MVLEFKHILQTFLSFLQREKFSKLKKLREGQRNLPIAVYREEILTTLEQNQVINKSLNKKFFSVMLLLSYSISVLLKVCIRHTKVIHSTYKCCAFDLQIMYIRLTKECN